MFRFRAGAFVVTCAALVTASLGARTTPDAVTRVLFIGNSLTTVNNVPALVHALARADRQSIECHTVAFNGFSLEDHWNQGDAGRASRRAGGRPSSQQGPSALPESRGPAARDARASLPPRRDVSAPARRVHGLASNQRRADFREVSASYAAAARDVGGMLLPAGDAWRAACVATRSSRCTRHESAPYAPRVALRRS
jgi:hypothetical protein